MFMQRTFHLIEITSLRTLDGNNQSLLWENRCNLSECAISTIGSWIWTDPELIAISYMPEICRWLEDKFRGGHLLHPVPADNLLALPVTLSQIELSQFHHLGTSQIHTSAAIRMSLWIMLPEQPEYCRQRNSRMHCLAPQEPAVPSYISHNPVRRRPDVCPHSSEVPYQSHWTCRADVSTESSPDLDPDLKEVYL